MFGSCDWQDFLHHSNSINKCAGDDASVLGLRTTLLMWKMTGMGVERGNSHFYREGKKQSYLL